MEAPERFKSVLIGRPELNEEDAKYHNAFSFIDRRDEGKAGATVNVLRIFLPDMEKFNQSFPGEFKPIYFAHDMWQHIGTFIRLYREGKDDLWLKIDERK